jgi:dynein heavy chain
MKLWVHESMRIFYDRLINEEDQIWFKKTACELANRHMKVSTSVEELFAKPIIFADFLKPDADPRFYEEVADVGKLTTVSTFCRTLDH